MVTPMQQRRVRQPATALQQPQNAHTHTHTNLHTSKHARATREAKTPRMSPTATTTTHTTEWHTCRARPVQKTAQPPLVTYILWSGRRGDGDGVHRRRHPCKNVGVRQPATALQQPQNAHTHTHQPAHKQTSTRNTRGKKRTHVPYRDHYRYHRLAYV